MNILIGADPEVFVRQNGVVVSGYGLIPGTKNRPHPVPNGAVQVDGMALEFNITPAASSEEFVSNIVSVLSILRAMVPKHELVLEAVAKFDKKYLDKQPEDAVRLGCDPDFNAYKLRRNPPPDQRKPFRTAAGHVHIGWTKGIDIYDPRHIKDCAKIVKNLDIVLGVPSVIFDNQKERRELYGKAGAFRPKPYGVEYRVLSNKWLQSIELIKFIYSTTFKTVNNLFDGTDLTKIITYADECINTSNKKMAIRIIKTIGMEPNDVLELGRCSK